jgi:hypothetical protein
LAAVLSDAEEVEMAQSIERAIAGSDIDLERFIVSDEMWGGSGSIADHAGMGEGVRSDKRRRIEAALADLGGEQVRLGKVNTRTASWVAAFGSWAEDDI